jgi:hypothetical protein
MLQKAKEAQRKRNLFYSKGPQEMFFEKHKYKLVKRTRKIKISVSC